MTDNIDNTEASKLPAEQNFADHFIITVEDFIKQNYEQKINDGDCIVGVLDEEPKREDYFDRKSYLANKAVFEKIVRDNPMGNFRAFQKCEDSGGGIYLMKSTNSKGGGETLVAGGDAQLLVFPLKKDPRINENNSLDTKQLQ